MKTGLLQQIGRFALVGVVGYIVNAGIVEALVVKMGPIFAQAFVFPIAVTVTWWLNRRYTFGASQHDVHYEWFRYVLANTLGWVANNGIYVWMVFHIPMAYKHPSLALAVGALAGMVFNFIMTRQIIFKPIRREKINMLSNKTIHEYIVFGDHCNGKKNKLIRLLLILLFSLFIGGLTSLFLGQDANWDLKNYHIHNAWAILNNRMEVDLFTAGHQSYFNPLLDLPYYMVAIDWFPQNPRLVAFLMGLPSGVLLFFVWLCAYEVISAFKVDRYFTLIATSIVVAMGMTGVATLSQWGTTFNETQVAVLVVVSIYVLITKMGQDKLNIKWFVIAGICLGCAAGLKLTASIYAPGALIVIVLMSRNLKVGVSRALGFCISWWSGFFMLYGWWGYRLYELTGSPMFPWFNSVFKSPLIDSNSWTDKRFMPIDIMEALFYPFHWVLPHSMVVTEPEFADPRFAVAYLALLMIVMVCISYCINNGPNSNNDLSKKIMPSQATTLIIWLVISYVLWQVMFSILRYTISIEVFTGLIILISFLVAVRLLNASNYSLVVIIPLLIIGVLFAKFTHYPDWGRVRFGEQVIEIQNVALANNGLVIFSGPPTAYLAPFLSKDKVGVSFIGITSELIGQRGYPLWGNITKHIKEQTGKIYMVERSEQIGMRIYLTELGLSINQASCREYNSSIDQAFTVCELQKTSHSSA